MGGATEIASYFTVLSQLSISILKVQLPPLPVLACHFFFGDAFSRPFDELLALLENTLAGLANVHRWRRP